MVVRIRLSRFGNRRLPFYNIVVCQARCARDSKPIEVLGTYNPLPKKPTGLNDNEVAKPYKELALDKSRTKYWLGVGAQPSDSVWKMFSMMGLITPKFTAKQ